MRFWSQICDNYYLGIALLAWFIAQLLKIFIDGWRYRKFDLKKIVSSGGMPSSHAATVERINFTSAVVAPPFP